MLFAQAANPDPTIAWNVVLTLGVLANLGVALLALSRSSRAQKREVNFAFEPASRANCEKLHGENAQEHRDLFAKLGGVERSARAALADEIKEMRATFRGDIQGIHTRINTIEKSMGGVEKAVELQNQNLAAMAAQMREMLRMQRAE